MENITAQEIIIFSIIAVIAVWLFLSKRKKTSLYKNNITDIQKRITPKPGRREYKFVCGIEAYQEELTWIRSVKVIDLIKEFGIESIVKKFKTEKMLPVNDVIDLLNEHKALERFLDRILIVRFKTESSSWSQLFMSELKVVFTDFFTLNPWFTELLGISNVAAAITLMRDSKTDIKTPEPQG